MTAHSFDQVKRLARLLEKSPMSADESLPLHKIPDNAAGEILPVLRAVQESLHKLNGLVFHARSDAGRWTLDTSDPARYDSSAVSPIKLLAEGGLRTFMELCDDEDEDLVREFLTDIVRIEWQFTQLLAEKPEQHHSYGAQLRQAYSDIVNRMKEELPLLPWISRSQVGDAVAA